MRKLAMLSTAMLGLAFFHPSYAQNASAPQSGLPPGASSGAIMAQPPPATGSVSTTRTGPVVSPVAVAEPTPAPVYRRTVRRRRHYVRHHYVRRHVAPTPVAAPQ